MICSGHASSGQHDPANGHRIKDPTAPGKVNWVHSILKQRKLLPADWIISYRQSGNAIPVSPETDGTEETPVTAPAVAFLTAKCPELRLLIDELGLEVLSESRPM